MSVITQEWPATKDIDSEYKRWLRDIKEREHVRTLCSMCGEFFEGELAKGRKWHATHLAKSHPDFEVRHTPRPKRKSARAKKK